MRQQSLFGWVKSAGIGLWLSATVGAIAQPLAGIAAEPTATAMPTLASRVAVPRTLKEAGIPAHEIVGQAAEPTTPSTASPPATTPPTSPIYERIPAQVNGVFTSGPGVGYESSFVGLDGFVPVWQSPGKDLAYIQGRLLLTTAGGNPGGNVLVGYRQFNPSNNSILGGYVSYDVRDSGRATFNQLGAGLEGIWSGFEMRWNGYLPTGNTRQTVDQVDFISGTSAGVTSRPRFQGNHLVFDLTRNFTQSRFQRDEVALGGFDLEGGLKLAQWQPDGDLRSYFGLYYYSGSDVSGFVGVRGRLLARINQYASVGVSIQGDREFGTTGAVTVALQFPGMSRSKTSKATSNWAHMGENATRNNHIAIRERTETRVLSRINTTEIQALRNPTTGQPYVFQHTVLGGIGGDGTFENPFDTVAAAIATAPGDGNGIVYVQAGTNPGIPAFTLKDGVQVLSTGPVQTLATVQQGDVQLPLSGSGTLPTVTGSVTMGNNTVLSGFAVTPPSGNIAISANAVQNVTILNNRVQVSGEDIPGIRLRDVSGTAIVRGNTISTTGNLFGFPVFPNGSFGIFADISTTLANLIVTGNTINNSGIAGHGISVTTRNTGTIANATVANNTIRTTGTSGLGILLLSLNTSLLDTVTVANNTINTSAVNAIGISVNPRDTSSMRTVSVSGNTVSTTGNSSHGIIVNSRNNSSITTITTSGNTILTTGANAFGILANPINSSVITTLGASNNSISTTGANTAAIYVIPQVASTILAATLASNTVSTTGVNAFGVYVIPQPNTILPTLTLTNNRILQSGSDNVRIANSTNQPICASFSGNVGLSPGGGGTNFALQSGVQPFRVIDLANLSLNNTGTFQFNGAAGPVAPFTNVATCP